MKIHQQPPRGSWDLHLTHNNSSSSCSNRRLRPLAPKSDVVITPQVEISEAGGTRWNPTPEQIGILEMLYSRGMRTPNSQQIEHIASQLSRFGKIQGKNVFYWFQNHKARERQKLKRLNNTPKTTSFSTFDNSKEKNGTEEPTTSKKKCTSWTFQTLIEETSCALDNNSEINVHGAKKTLELFPLHPELAREMN